MPKSSGQPKSIETQMESSDGEEREQPDNPPAPPDDGPVEEQAAVGAESVQSDDWWSMSDPVPDWVQPATDATDTEVIPKKEPGTADVYFCGHTNLFPLSRALRANAQDRLTGVLRLC